MIQTVNSRAQAKGFRSTALYSVVNEAVHKSVPKSPTVDAVATKLVDGPSKVPIAKFVKREVEKNSLDKAMMERQFVKFAKAAEEKKSKAENRITTKTIDTARSTSPPTDMSDDEIASLKATAP